MTTMPAALPQNLGKVVVYSALSVLAVLVVLTGFGLMPGSGSSSADDGRYDELTAPEQLGGFPRWHGMVEGELADAKQFARTYHARAIEATYLPPGMDPVLATAVSRIRWAGGHVTVALVGTALLLSAAGLGAGLEYAALPDEDKVVDGDDRRTHHHRQRQGDRHHAARVRPRGRAAELVEQPGRVGRRLGVVPQLRGPQRCARRVEHDHAVLLPGDRDGIDPRDAGRCSRHFECLPPRVRVLLAARRRGAL